MKNLISVLFILSVSIITISRFGKDDNDIDYIYVKYYTDYNSPCYSRNRRILEHQKTVIYSYPWDRNTVRRNIADDTIRDINLLNKINHALGIMKKGKRCSSSDLDVKVICNIKYRNGKVLYVDISGASVVINGYSYTNSNKFVYLIKNYSGYYSNFGELDLRYGFSELRDTCFKDTIEGINGFKFWRNKYK
jgi:hypothetical protein